MQKFSKLRFLEGYIANLLNLIKKAAPRFESGGDVKKLIYNKVFNVSKGVFTYHSPTNKIIN